MAWDENHYKLKKKVLAVAQQYFILNAQDELVGYVKQKVLKLKEDIRIFADETMQAEVLHIKQQEILDISGTFAVTDPTTGELVGYLNRKGLKSMFKDEWEIRDAQGQALGRIYEGGGALALLRRFLPLGFVPKTYMVEVGGQVISHFKQRFKVIGDIWELDFSADTNRVLDRRLGICGALMMSMIERKAGA